MTKYRWLVGFVLLTFGFNVYADGLGGVANNLFDGASILSKLLSASCVIVGILLTVTAFTQYKIHRQNPKLVPLGNPVTYFLLGLTILAVPFAGKLLKTDTSEDVAKSGASVEEASTHYIDLDDPL